MIFLDQRYWILENGAKMLIDTGNTSTKRFFRISEFYGFLLDAMDKNNLRTNVNQHNKNNFNRLCIQAQYCPIL
jgi:hypothetical protein